MKLNIAIVAAFVLTLMGVRQAFAFNLWTDIETETQWTLGKSASGGTAIALANNDALNLKSGDFVPSALASISQYRMLSLWYGGNQFVLADRSSVWKDTGKLGFNLVYIFKNFTNQPPDFVKNLVVGPSVTFNIFTAPHFFIPFLDVNYQFGGVASPPATTPAL